MRKGVELSIALTILLASLTTPVRGERLGYPPSEFTARRTALAERLGEGTVLLFGSTMPALAARFHQDHDFYYLTGNEDLNAVLVMEPIIEIKEKRLHVRIEDSVLITEGEPLILTAAAPKEVEELLALMAKGREELISATRAR